MKRNIFFLSVFLCHFWGNLKASYTEEEFLEFLEEHTETGRKICIAKLPENEFGNIPSQIGCTLDEFIKQLTENKADTFEKKLFAMSSAGRNQIVFQDGLYDTWAVMPKIVYHTSPGFALHMLKGKSAEMQDYLVRIYEDDFILKIPEISHNTHFETIQGKFVLHLTDREENPEKETASLTPWFVETVSVLEENDFGFFTTQEDLEKVPLKHMYLAAKSAREKGFDINEKYGDQTFLHIFEVLHSMIMIRKNVDYLG